MELWDLYDKNRVISGITIERGKPVPDGYYRLVVHACIFNSDGCMLIQQRQPFKEGWSNMWDISVGGSAIIGDSSQSACEREIYEEIGLKISLQDLRPALTVNFDSGFDDIYLINLDIDIAQLQLQQEEVQAVKWASKDEILQMIYDGTFIPYHTGLIELLWHMRQHMSTHTKSDTSTRKK